jgi:hypothetical protein
VSSWPDAEVRLQPAGIAAQRADSIGHQQRRGRDTHPSARPVPEPLIAARGPSAPRTPRGSHRGRATKSPISARMPSVQHGPSGAVGGLACAECEACTVARHGIQARDRSAGQRPQRVDDRARLGGPSHAGDGSTDHSIALARRVASNAAAARRARRLTVPGSAHTNSGLLRSLRSRSVIATPPDQPAVGSRTARSARAAPPDRPDLPPSDRPWAHPQGRHARFSLPYRHAQTVGETPTIPPPRQPGGAQRQLRARRWISTSCEIPVESVAPDGDAHAHNSSLDHSGGGVV